MANEIVVVFDNCRFCLSDHDLIPLLKASSNELSIQDVVYYTGIELTEDEQLYAPICDKCCRILEKIVALRTTALQNEATFKLLFTTHIERFKGDPISIGADQMTYSHIDAIESNLIEDDMISLESHSKALAEPSFSYLVETDDEYSSQETYKEPDNFSIEQSELFTQNTLNKPRELCNICGKLVFSYKNHSLTHTKEKKYSCPYCPKQFSMIHYRKRHVQTFHEKKIFKSCEICGTDFIHRNSYNSHMISKHGIGKKYECQICSKTYYRSSHYTQHYRSVHGNEEFSCTICPMVFKSKDSLRDHQSVHSDEKPYGCSLCPKRFKKREARKIHELTHSGIRFSCNLCEKSYRYKTLLSMHYRKHHEGAPSPEDNKDDSDI